VTAGVGATTGAVLVGAAVVTGAADDEVDGGAGGI
jgi:hypothetical protein